MNNTGCLLPLIFGLLGAFVGSLPGLIFGALLGYGISQLSFKKTNYRGSTIDNAVLESITKLSLVLMKADASVMRSELYLFRDFMVQNFGNEIAGNAIEMLQQFKDTPLTVEVAAGDINLRLNYTERMHVLRFLFQLAGADGAINRDELSVLSQIARQLEIHQNDFASLRMTFEYLYNRQRYQSGGYSYQQQEAYNRMKNSSAQEDDYAVLGVKSTDSNETIKAAYRRLAVANHPDKVEHLGEVARAEAEKRFSKINQAYHRIKKTRNL
ncbi:MAG: TerB family tellurite resistance protein [Bacteroidales bacterium]|jgi:DnaJ like chaperone protein|nr:TerB family tellurite resistance protein [Bacteroidales bacterium]